MKRKTVLLILLLLALCIAQSVQAMSSANFILDWFTPLTGTGRGPASSPHYAANYTIGQSAIGYATSPGYRAGIGYWHGILANFQTRLPLVTK